MRRKFRDGMGSSLEYFEVVAGHGFFRPRGRMSLDEAVQVVDVAIAHARDARIARLMVNGTRLTGFDPPTLSERFYLVEKWAHTARGKIRLAMVVRPEMIDPRKFGVTVAMNRRLIADVFVAERSATAWLESDDLPSFPCIAE